MSPTLHTSICASRQRDIYDLVQGFIGLLSPDGILLDANQSSLNFAGVILEDVVGKPFWDTPWWLGCPESQIALRKAVKRGASGNASRFEALSSGKDGALIYVDFSLTPIFDHAGDVTSLVPEARDISAIKETSNALLESETRLRLAHDVAEIGTWDWDLTNDQLRWDDRQFDLFGISIDQERMRGEKAIATIHPDDHDRVATALADAVENDVPFHEEFRVIHESGEVRWLVGRGHTLHHDDAGKPMSMIGVNYDITEQKKIERRLAQSNLDLEAGVAERTRQLEEEMLERQKTQEALAHAQRLESIGQLAGGVAHDFNNLLAVIGGNLELAEMRIEDDRVKELIQDALEAVEAGASLNRRLLSFARKYSLKPTKIGVNERIENAKQLLERTLDGSIVLDTMLAPDVWGVFADAGELDSAILNLAVNARDAMPTGGILSIATCNRTFNDVDVQHIPESQAGEFVQLSIADTGTGMTPDVLEKAVTPFFTTKDAGKGSGLGLSSVFGFARQSGGFVSIQSEQGVGTTVNIYLPRSSSQSNEETTKASLNDMPLGSGQLILVVEDDDAVRRLTHERLLELKYKVIEASTVAEAKNLLQKYTNAISLIFSDVRMPGDLTGYDLAGWAHENCPKIKVLMTSGYDASESGGGQGDLERDVKMLPKPHSMAKLATALRKSLELPTDRE